MAFSDQVILDKLAQLMAETGRRRIKQQALADATGAHINTVKRATRRLAQSGRIVRVRTPVGYEYKLPHEHPTGD